MAVIAGKLSVSNQKFAIVVSRFNELVTKALLEGALDCFKRHGAPEKNLTVVWVPGAAEIPQAAQKLAEGGKHKAVVTLGCVIRGATSHYEAIVDTVTRGVAKVAMDTRIPVIFGVLTTENLEQALERAGSKAGNKGWDAALAAIDMASVWDQLK